MTSFETLLNKQYFLTFLFLILFLITYIPYYRKFKANIRLINGKDDDNFIYYDSLRINNRLHLLKIILYVFIYLVINILFILYLRYNRLGVDINLALINPWYMFTISNFVLFVSFLLFLYAYIQFTDVVFFPQIVKLYLYINKIIYPFLFDYVRENRFFIKTKLASIWVFLSYTYDSDTRKLQDSVYRNSTYDYEELSIFSRYTKKRAFYEYVSTRPYLYNICFIIYCLLNIIINYIDSFFRQIVFPIVLLVLLYDINQGRLYYIYYSLFFYTVILLIRKFIEFVWALDIYGIDYKIHELLYEGVYLPNIKESTKRLQESDDRYGTLTEMEYKEYMDIINMQTKQQEMYPMTNEYLTYLLGNLKIRAVLDNGDPLNWPDTVWPVRRFLLLVASFYSLYYICYIRDIKIILFKSLLVEDTSILLIGTIIYLIIFVLWYITGYDDKRLRYGKSWQIYGYIILTYSSIILAVFLFLNTKLILLSTEVLINLSYLTILDYFALEDKVYFINNYTTYLGTVMNIDDNNYIQIITQLYFAGYQNMLNFITLDQIRHDLEDLFSTYINIKMHFYSPTVVYDIINQIVHSNIPNDSFFNNQAYIFIRNSIVINVILGVFVKATVVISIALDIMQDPVFNIFKLAKKLFDP